MADAGESKSAKGGARKWQAPKGTRDFYPEDLLRKRYIVETWRAVSLRHGFEEIDGPTFEHLDLYTVKSGEGIVSELFSFKREGGDDTYALRPEFTPTLARMYAARAAQLPKPVRWFCVPSFFRAERPQRGRLREFLQWNCDVIGSATVEIEDAAKQIARDDASLLSCVVDSLQAFGFRAGDAEAKVHDRRAASHWCSTIGVPQYLIPEFLQLRDRASKLSLEAFIAEGAKFGVEQHLLRVIHLRGGVRAPLTPAFIDETAGSELGMSEGISVLRPLASEVESRGLAATKGTVNWIVYDSSIVRGLAYYTGMVFEVIAEGERAVAGGGRYDNLIELFGGPPTPAVGFGMGDVVLSNLLDDKGLMPSGAELAIAVDAVVRSQRIRPEVVVASNGDEATEPMVTPLVARLRRGVEAEGFAGRPWEFGARYVVRPVHARTSTKNPKRLNKVLEDAEKQGARFAAIIHGDDKVQVRDLDRREDVRADLHVDPASGDRYVGRALVAMFG